jgi:heme/copper-type cytochrome/quinol oxidase subunit 2
MKSNTTRVIAGIAVVAVAVVLLIVLKDDGKSDSEKSDNASNTPAQSDQTATGGNGQATPATPTIVIKNGKPVGGIAELTYNAGDQIRFKVDSDVSEEIHVHGYDLMKDVEAGGSVTFDFPASIEGVFEAELEGRGEQIAELTVNP